MLIAFAIVTLCLTAVIGIVFGNQSLSVGIVTNDEAIGLSQQILEKERALAEADFASIDPSQPSVDSYSGPNGMYKTSWQSYFTLDQYGNPNPYEKMIVSTTTWSEGGRKEEVALHTIVSSPQDKEAGNDCQVPLTANWSSPKLLNSTKVTLGAGTTPTAVVVRGKYAYIASQANPSTTGTIFSVVDVSDKKTLAGNPNAGSGLVSPIKTINANDSHFGGVAFPEIDAIYLEGKYAYVMGYPHGGNGNDQGGTIFVKNSVAYVGTYNGNNTQFAIIDISIPTAPQVVSGSRKDITGGTFAIVDATVPSAPTISPTNVLNWVSDQINQIQVYNQKAYVSVEGFGSGVNSGSGQGFIVLNVGGVPSSPPTLDTFYDFGDHGYGMVTRNPNNVLLGGHDKSGAKGGLELLNTTVTPLVPDAGISVAADRLVGIISPGKYVFVASQDPNRLFNVVALDTTARTLNYVTGLSSSPTDLNVTGGTSKTPASGFDCQNNYFYQATNVPTDALKIIGPGIVITPQVLDQNEVDVTSGTATIGTNVHARVQVAAGTIPGGTVDFLKFYNDSTCSTLSSTESAVALTNGAAESSPFTLSTGPISYKVHYNGDATYGPRDSGCVNVTGVKFTPQVVSSAHNASHKEVTTVKTNTPFHGAATVTGAGPALMGTATFTLFTDNKCTKNPVVGGTVNLVGGVADPSSAFTKGNGNYWVGVSYSGDANYLPTSFAQGPSCTPVTVAAAAATMSDDVYDQSDTTVLTGASVAVGTKVHDRVTVSGNLSGIVASGNVTFSRYATNNCGGAVTTETLPLDSNGQMSSSNATSNGVGSLSYKVAYAGDGNYPSVPAGACHKVSFKYAPTVTSQIQNSSNVDITNTTVVHGTVVHDKANVTGTGPTSPGATADFNRYTNGTCQGIPAHIDGNKNLVGGAVNSPNFTTVAGQMSYLVHYDGDANYLSADGACEPLTVN